MWSIRGVENNWFGKSFINLKPFPGFLIFFFLQILNKVLCHFVLGKFCLFFCVSIIRTIQKGTHVIWNGELFILTDYIHCSMYIVDMLSHTSVHFPGRYMFNFLYVYGLFLTVISVLGISLIIIIFNALWTQH